MSEQDANNGMTVTDLLRQQHMNVKQMFTELGQAQGKARSELFDCVRATLAVHETAEEIVVHPEAKEIGDEGARIAEARLAEESKAKEVLADLEKIGPDGDGFASKLAGFEAMVLAHAQAEERELFPLLEANIQKEKLVAMADKIRVAEKLAPTHPHPHGPESGIGNLLVGPFVAMVDKVRDKLHERAGSR